MTFTPRFSCAPALAAGLFLLGFFGGRPVQAQYSFRTVAQSGREAPGAQGENFVFVHPFQSFISNGGDVLFRGGSGSLMDLRMGFWLERSGETRLLMLTGDQAPGLPAGVVFARSGIVGSDIRGALDPLGNAAVYTPLEGPGIIDNGNNLEKIPANSTALFVETDGGLELIAQGGRLIEENFAFLNTSGEVAFRADLHAPDILAHPSFLPPFSNNRFLLPTGNFVYDRVNEERLEDSPGVHLERKELSFELDEEFLFAFPRFGRPVAMPGRPTFELTGLYTYLPNPVLNPSGQFAFVASGEHQPESGPGTHILCIYRGDTGSLESLACQEEEQNTVILPKEHLTINAAGQVAFLGEMPPSLTGNAVWVFDAPGVSRAAVRIGDPVPGGDGATLTNIGHFALLDDGRIAFSGETSDGHAGVWIETDTGLKKIVLSGDPAPGTEEGTVFSSISSVAVNNEGRAAFSAGLAGPSVTDFLNDHGLWIGEPDGMELALRAGDQMEVPGLGQQRILQLDVRGATGGFSTFLEVTGPASNGRSTHFNDNGDIVFAVRVSHPTDPFSEIMMLVVGSQSIVVNHTGDTADSDPGDGECDTGGPPVNDEPECTLRAALQTANAREGRDRITFAIPGAGPHTIRPASVLPVIQDPVSIEGSTSETGTPTVTLDGSAAGEGANGLSVDFSGRGSEIRSLTVVRFGGHGILLSGTTEVRVTGNTIGTNAAGGGDLGNGGDGIHLDDSFFNRLGGLEPGQRNVISGNGGNGILITAATGDRNIIEGNFIGTTPDGAAARANEAHGIRISGGSSENILTGNVVSGNTAFGIALLNDASARTEDNELKDNTVGLNQARTAAVANGEGGILIDGSRTNLISGLESESLRKPNVISGNTGHGIEIRGAQAGTNIVSANLIGTSGNGSVAIQNEGSGLYINGAPGTRIGGIAATVPGTGPSNVISGNEAWGIHVEGTGATETVIEGNLIGTDLDGTSALRNGLGGILIQDATGVLIGGPGPSETLPPGTMPPPAVRNVISGHGQGGIGILIQGAGAQDNVVVGNFIGLNAAGDGVIPNTDGIVISSGVRNRIGLSVAAGDGYISYRPNWFAGNSDDGIRLEIDAKENVVLQNLIGVLPDYSRPAEPVGAAGIRVVHAQGNRLLHNYVSGHDAEIVVEGARSRLNRIQSNRMEGVEGRVTGGIRIEDAPENELRYNFLVKHYQVGIRINGAGAKRNLIVGNTVAGQFDAVLFMGILVEDALGTRIGLPRGPDLYSIDDGNRVTGTARGIVLRRTTESRVISNTVNRNSEVGILIENAALEYVAGNTIRHSPRGIAIEGGSEALIRLENNDIKENTGTNSGVHIAGASVVMTGNQITGDAGNGVSLHSGASLTARGNNIFGNAGSGIFLSDASSTADARMNWWGEAGGPGGAGPGTGDEVSAGVDFFTWRTTPVALVLSAAEDTVYVPVGAADTVYAAVRNWQHPTETADVTVSDSLGWIQGPGAFAVTLNDTASSGVAVPITAPASPGRTTLRFTATSQTNAADVASDSVVVVAYTAGLFRIAVAPDTAYLQPGQEQTFTALGEDQGGGTVSTSVAWSATGGAITDAGTYTAGEETGTYVVTATDPTGAIQGHAAVHISTEIDVEENPAGELPADFALHQSYPNPFNRTTTIPFDVRAGVRVVLKVYDVLGREIATLVDEERAPGRYRAVLEGQRLPSGIYFYSISMGGFQATRKMMIVR